MSSEVEELSLEAEQFQPRQLSPVETLRHSTAHLMASAIDQLFPGTKFAIGPNIEHGFYYDMELETPLTEADLPRIEEKMREIAKGNHKF
jgi:threonyl-tRNA synthetase